MATDGICDKHPSAGGCKRGRLIVLVRYPVPGRSKARLIPAVGAVRAAELDRRMAAAALASARELRRGMDVDIEVRHAGGSHRQVRQWLGGGMPCTPQGPGDLGQRIKRAFDDAFAAGAARAAVVGTDCPALRADNLREAFDALDAGDVALGPSTDGGYWLIALRRPADLFADVAWSTESVLSQTLERTRQAGLTVRTLSMLADVDRPDDLPALPGPLREVVDRPYVSVIIPTLNEAGHVATTVASARHEAAEIIVADAGSTDGTAAIARQAGAQVIAAPRGRALQMNAAAETARGAVLLFLHGDTTLPGDYVEHVFAAFADRRVVGGAFEFGTGPDTPARPLTEALINLRTRHLRMPYGDQGIFISADLFRALGGYDDVPILEDVRLVRRIKQHGRLSVVPAAVRTSGRRWKARGVVKPTMINMIVLVGSALGVPLTTLARFRHGGNDR